MSRTTETAPAVDITAPDQPQPTARRKRKRPSVGMMFGVIWLGALGFMAVFADYLPFIRKFDQAVRGAGRFRVGPGSDFWFGSDQLGRDVFARCIYGAQISLRVSVTSILVGLLIGGTMGMAAGYYRGWIDRVVSITVDTLLAFPPLIMAILIVGRFDRLNLDNGWTWLTRTWSITIVLGVLSSPPWPESYAPKHSASRSASTYSPPAAWERPTGESCFVKCSRTSYRQCSRSRSPVLRSCWSPRVASPSSAIR